MNFEEIVSTHQALTLGELENSNSSSFFAVVNALGLQDIFTPDTPIKDIPALLNTLTQDQSDQLRQVDIRLDSATPTTPGTPGVEDLKAISSLSPRESNGRFFIGALFCLVMAFTIIVFTMVIALVAVKRMEFPSTTLCAVIVLPTMYVAWFYMGIINKERRDILSALVGTKISPGAIAAIIDAIRKPK